MSGLYVLPPSSPGHSLTHIFPSATLGLSLSVITHPTLIVRIVLVAVFTVLGTVLCLLPFPRVGQIALRLASCTLGSFGTVLCIAILARNPAWANVWERLWMHDGTTWGTSQEKGLSAGYCLLICLGLACDTFLHTKFGENPDEVSIYNVVCIYALTCLMSEMGPVSGQV